MSAAESGQDENQQNPIQRASERKRAWRIRKKPESERTQEERDWFSNYEATKANTGRPTKGETEAQEVESDESEPATEESPPPPPPPPPPRINVDDGNRSDGNSDWRKSYTKEAKGAGRKATVELIASQWKGILDALAEQIKMCGKSPVVDIDALYKHLVVTVDDALPDHIEIKSSHIAAFGTTAILVQRFVNRKEITEAYERNSTKVVEVNETIKPKTESTVSSTPPNTQNTTQIDSVAETPKSEEPKPVEPLIKVSPASIAPEYKIGANDVV